MSRRADVEPIRRWPRWLARAANRVIGWTNDYCAGGCGYPITRRFSYTIEEIGETRVVFGVCSLDSLCYERAAEASQTSYIDYRPEVVENLAALREAGEDIRVVTLTGT